MGIWKDIHGSNSIKTLMKCYYNQNYYKIVVKRFYKTLFRYYLRILWSFSAIKDEELLDLKTKYLNTKMDKMFQNTMINGNTVKLITPDKVSEILQIGRASCRER